MESARNINPAANIVPDSASNADKKTQIAQMFNNIAGNYDFLNHFLSMGIDKGWRKKAIAVLRDAKPASVLDVATGTGDLAIAAMAAHPKRIQGIDIAEQMLEVGRKKVADKNLSATITLSLGDSEAIPYANNEFDAVTCAYGVRNFADLEAGLTEMCRVLKPGGKLIILEFSKPQRFPMKQLYFFYFKAILPLIGKIVSKHSTAYSYLPESVMSFPQGNQFCEILAGCGFSKPHARPLTMGITTLYTATKA